MFSSDIGGTAFTVVRDCPASPVPEGDALTLDPGQTGSIMQTSERGLLVYVEGNLLRIDTAHLDALDRSPPKPPAMPENAGDADGRILISRTQPIPGVGGKASAATGGRDEIEVLRDFDAVMVPQGDAVTLTRGQSGYVTQAVGGSFTIFVDGNLYRVAGEDAGAIGKECPAPLRLPDDANDQDVEALAWSQLRTCFDPEIPVNVVDLGLVYGLTLARAGDGRRNVHVRLTLTAPGCGMGDVLVDDAASKLKLIPTVADVTVELVFEPPWNYSMMSAAARLDTGMM